MKRFCDLKVGDILEFYSFEGFESKKIENIIKFGIGNMIEIILEDKTCLSVYNDDLEKDFLNLVIDGFKISTSMDRLLLELEEC